MKGKLAFVLGAAVGYVLGTRAGRERYEQIKRGAQKVWNTEPVQRGVTLVRDAVDEKADDVKSAARRFGSQLLGKLSEQAAGTSRDAGAARSTKKAAGTSSSGGSDADASGDDAETETDTTS